MDKVKRKEISLPLVVSKLWAAPCVSLSPSPRWASYGPSPEPIPGSVSGSGVFSLTETVFSAVSASAGLSLANHKTRM